MEKQIANNRELTLVDKEQWEETQRKAQYNQNQINKKAEEMYRRLVAMHGVTLVKEFIIKSPSSIFVLCGFAALYVVLSLSMLIGVLVYRLLWQ